MKKIKITQKQANLIGIKNNLTETKKSIVKITKEQYNRIFASGLIKETINPIDKSFRQGFSGKDIDSLGENNDFNITKPNTDLPISANGKFGKPMMEGENDLRNETIELIKYLYRKSTDLSPFWEEHDLSFDDICDALSSKGLIIAKNGKHELSKSLGSPEKAIQTLEDELRVLIGEPQTSSEPEPELQPENYPLGAEDDPNAPYNQTDNIKEPTSPSEVRFEPVYFNNEIIVLKSINGELYVFFYDSVNKEDFMEYASVQRKFIGKDEDGQPEYEYGNDFEIDADVVSNYVNNNLDTLSFGEGANAYERGADLVKIDNELKDELVALYSNDKNLIKLFGPVQEEKSLGDIKTDFKTQLTDKPKVAPNQSQIITKLQALKQQEKDRRDRESTDIEETTSAASSGAFTGPLNAPPIHKEIPTVTEMTSGSDSVGAYDTNAFPNIKRDGTFKENKKSNAEKKTQWADGSFVDFNDCTKLNNKPAGAGCSQGAVDGVVKLKKTKGNINAPSLGENTIYETIAKKTGKTIDEVKRIIKSKK